MKTVCHNLHGAACHTIIWACENCKEIKLRPSLWNYEYNFSFSVLITLFDITSSKKVPAMILFLHFIPLSIITVMLLNYEVVKLSIISGLKSISHLSMYGHGLKRHNWYNFGDLFKDRPAFYSVCKLFLISYLFI